MLDQLRVARGIPNLSQPTQVAAMTYFAAITKSDARSVIYGIGTSADEAIRDAAEYGADTDDLRAVPCTEALYNEVQQSGGDVEFDEQDGTLDCWKADEPTQVAAMSYNPVDLPADVAIHADAEDGSAVITRISTDRFPEEVRELLATEGIWGAHRSEDGRVVVVTRDGEHVETDIEVSPDGYVFA